MAEINSNELALSPESEAKVHSEEKVTEDRSAVTVVDTVDGQSIDFDPKLIDYKCDILSAGLESELTESDGNDVDVKPDYLAIIEDYLIEVELPDHESSAEFEDSFSGAIYEPDNEINPLGISDIGNITFASSSSLNEACGSKEDIAHENDEIMDANATLDLIRILINENKSQQKLVQEMKATLRFVMSKYRQSVSYFLQKSDNKVFKDLMRELENVKLRRSSETDLVLEMKTVMTHAANMDDDAADHCGEMLARLSLENKGLREMLKISTDFKSTINYANKSVQTHGLEKGYYYFLSDDDDECSFHTARSPTGSINSLTIDIDEYQGFDMDEDHQGSSGSDTFSDDGVSSVQEVPTANQPRN